MEVEIPKTVRWMLEAVSERLGRPAASRKVRNREEWYVYDPVFSYIQRGAKGGIAGYRVGFCFNPSTNNIDFTLVHSPIMCRVFKVAIDVPTLLRVAEDTNEYRFRWNWMHWSSKHALSVGDGIQHLAEEGIDDFLREVQAFDDAHDLVKDMFPSVPPERKVGANYAYAGHYFTFLLSDRASVAKARSTVHLALESAWPLFQCLYPLRPIEKRSAGLNRKMVARGIPKRCEFCCIKANEHSYIKKKCKGEIEAAHIKPDSQGGSDLPENGMWLCKYHHQMTEGHLRGNRDETEIRVRFVAGPRS